MQIKSTKSYYKLPCAHAQWFSADESGEPFTGECAKLHGYDRSIHFEFSGTPDENGWIVGFGYLKPLKAFLEYYFDHTALLPANDPRLDAIMKSNNETEHLELRVLPYGVSMEATALFIWEQVNPFIHRITDGRCGITRVEVREHDSNSAEFNCTTEEAIRHGGIIIHSGVEAYMVEQPYWDAKSVNRAMKDAASI